MAKLTITVYDEHMNKLRIPLDTSKYLCVSIEQDDGTNDLLYQIETLDKHPRITVKVKDSDLNTLHYSNYNKNTSVITRETFGK